MFTFILSNIYHTIIIYIFFSFKKVEKRNSKARVYRTPIFNIWRKTYFEGKQVILHQVSLVTFKTCGSVGKALGWKKLSTRNFNPARLHHRAQICSQYYTVVMVQPSGKHRRFHRNNMDKEARLVVSLLPFATGWVMQPTLQQPDMTVAPDLSLRNLIYVKSAPGFLYLAADARDLHSVINGVTTGSSCAKHKDPCCMHSATWEAAQVRSYSDTWA